MFLFLVLIHELWHFIAAKISWVKVLEFGMGIPPKVFTLWTDKSGTEYTINAFPLWGFVRLKWEDPEDQETFKAKDSFVMASFFSKTIILFAGVTVNFLFAWLVFTWLFWRWLSPLMMIPENASNIHIDSYLTPTTSFLVEKGYINTPAVPVEVSSVVTGSIADSMGLLSWDIIDTTNNIPVDSLNFQKQLYLNIGKELVFDVSRWDEKIKLTGTCPGTNCLIGVLLNIPDNDDLVVYRFPLWMASKIALDELYSQWYMTLSRLKSLWLSLVSGSKKTMKEGLSGLSWPVGAVKFSDVLIENGMRAQFLAFGAMISFALAIFNLLPIPALDGGRRLWVVIQTIFFPKQIEKYFIIEWYINFVVFVLLMILWVYVMLKDFVVAWGFSIPFIG